MKNFEKRNLLRWVWKRRERKVFYNFIVALLNPGKTLHAITRKSNKKPNFIARCRGITNRERVRGRYILWLITSPRVNFNLHVRIPALREEIFFFISPPTPSLTLQKEIMQNVIKICIKDSLRHHEKCERVMLMTKKLRH